ncbi:unnamed protein product [Diatraea saccharalis]|uniref:F-box domain-containing protein n=1 Tax=Diatraea saccharalis TaxID=40085 RepID=A0A9N9QUU9_9NEOP|nr:unnamed protein product [Diatraea saccharalis]
MEEESQCYIISLPIEVLTLILRKCKSQDIVAFASTSKDFREIVLNNQTLWKYQFKPEIPYYMFESLEKNGDGNWFFEITEFHLLKKRIMKEVLDMSPKYYRRCGHLSLEDVRSFFDIALSRNVNYFYVIFILQDLVRKAKKNIHDDCAKKPYTMTEMIYAKIILRHLIHTFLAVKWVKSRMNNNDMPPEFVVNFFMQWADSYNWHHENDITVMIDQIVSRVQNVLDAQQPRWASLSIAERIASKVLNEKQVLSTITQVLFPERNMRITALVNLSTLSVTQALKYNCASFITMAVIYNAVANRCCVGCKLVSFPSHLFLEWRDMSDIRQTVPYSIDLGSGELRPKRRCPFSKTDHIATYKYCPDSLLQYIYSVFNSCKEGVRDWSKQNSTHLLDFLGNRYSDLNPYRNFLTHLNGNPLMSSMNADLDITNLQDEQIQIIRSLAYLNTPVEPIQNEVLVRRRNGHVKYAVGMVCCHKKFDYVGVIRGWDHYWVHNLADRMEINLNLQYGIKQPFYFVTAEDQSSRYVAQENLLHITHPCRLANLEDTIAREFTHFDGFAYVPNDQKLKEYPDDPYIVNVFRYRCRLMP